MSVRTADGGGGGIGRAVCRILARDGARVVATDINSKSVEETVSMLVNPGEHVALSMNVTDKASVESVVKATIDKLQAPPSLGTFLVTQVVTSALVEHGITSGSIVNLSSIMGKTGNIGQCNYGASKAAVQGLTKSSALELARVGVRVNCVLPGFTQTPMVETVPEKVQKKVLKLTPLNRFAQPEEIAEVVAFLLSDKSSFMTGSCVEVTGGLGM
ncbi:Estradiol 17-beta-dehydrogenase 8-like 3 [Homarus americanus]|uniref:Estradiol 17-beta-dehydrogenase 8-like 3 n=1 Tax=Homarus americanus TaxID=6706 RepID=A0A8J5JSF8_HOMAM|nr:Estradiol 17-beta-dehydrogenase 8-like 3 [Homarus americanus]